MTKVYVLTENYGSGSHPLTTVYGSVVKALDAYSKVVHDEGLRDDPDSSVKVRPWDRYQAYCIAPDTSVSIRLERREVL